MLIFKKILDFYINSSLHVALSAFALVSMTQYFFGVEGDFSVTLFAFFGTVVGYNFVKYDAITRLNKTEIKKELKAIVFLSFISLLACFYFFLQLSWDSKLSAFIFFGLTLLYTLPFFPNKQNARNWKGVKIYIVGITWVGVTVILPLVEAEIPFSTDVLLMAFQRFLLVFSIVLVFDIVDVKYDDIHLQTVPQKIGVKLTKKLGYLLLFLLLLLEFFYTNNQHFLPFFFKLLVCGTIAIFLFFANENRSRYYASFWLESVPILWWLVLILTGFKNLSGL
ncbi:UbiA prenyltransferase family protein [Flavobacterium proteolyticum]|uniref:Prenyltransferase n=1 Tax=Flavobacterium proteolyticum TaxID=2911683 RepID=A0ABR9WRI1_9FLAO|nr:hypothetical protein [Flavobacterium proteolyticum]MBE9576527.1 hypothetical protein [Flavobacterium proteolyticum]